MPLPRLSPAVQRRQRRRGGQLFGRPLPGSLRASRRCVEDRGARRFARFRALRSPRRAQFRETAARSAQWPLSRGRALYALPAGHAAIGCRMRHGARSAEAAPTTGSESPPAPADHPRPAYAWFVVGVLVVASLVSYIDRQIVAIVVAPMKADLHASDSEIGWLYGVFALFFAIAGMPIAMLADRYSRTKLITAGVFIWSALTAVCGLATSFVQVLLARIGVGVGEAVLTPAATSLIADCFPRPKIPFAISVFMVGSTIGSGLAFVVGGFVLGLVQGAGRAHVPLLGDLGAWQQVFLVCGLPGLLLVPFLLLVREPQRRYLSAKSSGGASMSEILAFYRANRATLLLHHLGFLCFSLMGFGFVFWSITFFARVHGMQASTAAQIFGWLQLVFASLGSVWAPTLAARLARDWRGG